MQDGGSTLTCIAWREQRIADSTGRNSAIHHLYAPKYFWQSYSVADTVKEPRESVFYTRYAIEVVQAYVTEILVHDAADGSGCSEKNHRSW
jgi:hypothetical protein